MNYITEIKAFYDLVSVKRLSTGQIVLWHSLMYINNKCAWTEWFTVPNRTLELYTGMSRQSIVNARNILKQYGLIDFKTNGVKAMAYILKSLQVPLQDALQPALQVPLQPALQDALPLNKLNKTKLDGKENNKRKDMANSANELFERLWHIYPNKKGKGQVSESDKLSILEIGEEEMTRAIDRYKDGLKAEPWRKPQNGSTFFHSGYIDYLDSNYEPVTARPLGYDGVREL